LTELMGDPLEQLPHGSSELYKCVADARQVRKRLRDDRRKSDVVTIERLHTGLRDRALLAASRIKGISRILLGEVLREQDNHKRT